MNYYDNNIHYVVNSIDKLLSIYPDSNGDYDVPNGFVDYKVKFLGKDGKEIESNCQFKVKLVLDDTDQD